MKIFRFVKKVFFIGLTILADFTNVSSLNANSLSCISVKNQECKTRAQVINVNGDEPVFFAFGIETSKCCGICNNINYPHECKFGENVCNNKRRWNKMNVDVNVKN